MIWLHQWAISRSVPSDQSAESVLSDTRWLWPVGSKRSAWYLWYDLHALTITLETNTELCVHHHAASVVLCITAFFWQRWIGFETSTEGGHLLPLLEAPSSMNRMSESVLTTELRIRPHEEVPTGCACICMRKYLHIQLPVCSVSGYWTCMMPCWLSDSLYSYCNYSVRLVQWFS